MIQSCHQLQELSLRLCSSYQQQCQLHLGQCDLKRLTHLTLQSDVLVENGFLAGLDPEQLNSFSIRIGNISSSCFNLGYLMGMRHGQQMALSRHLRAFDFFDMGSGRFQCAWTRLSENVLAQQ